MMDVKAPSMSEVNKATANEASTFDPDRRIDTQAKREPHVSAYNPDKRVELNNEKTEVNGGPYSDVFTPGEGGKKEVHHMPSSESSFLRFEDGPTIKMDIEDHRQTASWGRSKEACQYRALQKEMIENGDFRGALQMDIDDIQEKFGDKYNDTIAEMMDYVDQLEAEGKI